MQPLLKILESHSAIRTALTKPPGIVRAISFLTKLAIPALTQNPTKLKL